jgi:NAD(P)-dependent dehydrogenase (short-subunit alcohol dehydrogenase family)
MTERIAVVTGANRGIGLDVCRQLAQQGFTVALTARDPAKARAAAALLNLPAVHPYPLDIADAASIAAFAERLRADFGRLDVLVNNAAILPDEAQSAVTIPIDMARAVLETNLIGAWALTQALIPLIRLGTHRRIVNVSSGMGSLSDMDERHSAPAYSLSKAALNALTRLLAADLRAEGVLVNAVCPGWVATDMGGPGGRPIRLGAASVVWAVMLPDDGPTGGFFRDGQPIPW